MCECTCEADAARAASFAEAARKREELREFNREHYETVLAAVRAVLDEYGVEFDYDDGVVSIQRKGQWLTQQGVDIEEMEL